MTLREATVLLHAERPSVKEYAMDFGYFTLSDNYYLHNPRTASDFVLEIRE